MSDEARIRVSLEITNGNLNHRSYPTDYNADVSGQKGPTPGAIGVTIYGTVVDFSELTTPGFCRLSNQSDTETVDYGMYDPETDKFYPLGEIPPGEFYLVRFSSLMGGEYPGAGTGTGTSGPITNNFMIRSRTESCDVLVEAFEA
jgi:hypothetical protein